MIYTFPLSMKFTGRLFTLIGLCMLAGMIYFTVNTSIFMISSVETTGRITDYVEADETGTDGVEKKVFYPVIEFIDMDGKTQRFRSEVSMDYEVWVFIKARESGFTNLLYKVPDIKVFYNPESPSEARAARSFADVRHAEIALGISSVIFLIVGLALLRYAEKRNQ
ncbi:MAG TPA: DUF3592 domain-containing protein [Spirochaetota bacterium]|nr:DUF3592 domain-containing protein [Spirochaetota bacterium]HPF05564.1 DUF3592 domain-containing protein [Spirochaetota bacterium]HPJ41527.1 DUF3592 domain-containing protein [Spirochaetota bacterium]HPR36889.1 DUF3592 domain-containing protein [Spirochaetota bacterium]HRX47413.1 DUF3592 domain-containing protein [Spirochaetota bacterium]